MKYWQFIKMVEELKGVGLVDIYLEGDVFFKELDLSTYRFLDCAGSMVHSPETLYLRSLAGVVHYLDIASLLAIRVSPAEEKPKEKEPQSPYRARS